MTLHRINGTGLSNVFLKNGYLLEGEGSGQTVSYADLDGLYEAIAFSIARRSAPLTGPELKFLRRRLGMSQEQVGAMVDKTNQAVAKWEKGTATIPTADSHMMRLAWLTKYARREIARSVDRMVQAREGVPGDYVYVHDGMRWTDDAANSVFQPLFTSARSEAADAIMPSPVKADKFEFEWGHVASSLFQDQGIDRGLWRLAVKVHFAALTGQFQMAPDGPTVGLPTGMVGMAGLALMPATEPGPMVFDASAAYTSRRRLAVPRKKAAAKRA